MHLFFVLWLLWGPISSPVKHPPIHPVECHSCVIPRPIIPPQR